MTEMLFDGNIEVILEPTFVSTPLPVRETLPEAEEFVRPNVYNDTSTVVVVGLGHREAVLIYNANGNGNDGDPVGYNNTQRPDGRHFRTPTFPVLDGSLRVFLRRKNNERELLNGDIDGFVTDNAYGYIILKHPLEPNELLRVEYISPSDENLPRIFIDPEELYEVHGAPSLENPLSLAANMAFANGASRVLAVQPATHDRDPFWADAFAALEKEKGYYLVVVPQENMLSIISLALRHVQTMEQVSYQLERSLMVGEFTTETESLTRDDTEFLQDKRVQFFAPEEAFTVTGGETTVINGLYIAAAAAGFLSAQQPFESLTNKTLLNFTLDPVTNKSRVPPSETTALLDAGVTLVTPLATGGVVKRSITALGAGSSIEIQEPSVVRIRDFLAIQLRELLKPFVGLINTPQVVTDINTATANFLDGQVAAGLLKGYSNVSVVVDDIDPRQVNVEFTATAVVPLLFVHVAFSVVAS